MDLSNKDYGGHVGWQKQRLQLFWYWSSNMAAMTAVAYYLFHMWSARDQVRVKVQVSILNFSQLDTHVIRTPIARAIVLFKKSFQNL